MNIVVIVGNGVDLANELNTSYTDFYKHLKKNRREIVAKNKILNKWENLLETDENPIWSNLERFIGQASSEFDSYADFQQDKEFIDRELYDYLIQQQFKNFPQATDEQLDNFTGFLDYLPEKLSKNNKNQLLSLISYYAKKEGDHARLETTFVTLNYTDTLEAHLPIVSDIPYSENYSDMYLDNNTKYFADFDVCFPDLVHLHGSLSDGLILGLNDPSQLANKFSHDELQLDSDVIFKRNAQSTLRMSNLTQQTNKIWNADITIILGTELGVTDLYISQLLMENIMHNNRSIIIFQNFIAEEPKSPKTILETQAITKKYEQLFFDSIFKESDESFDWAMENQSTIKENLKRLFIFNDYISTENLGSLKFPDNTHNDYTKGS
ncbi:AbiH family protein [Weissella confusa]|uniref:AbiH family protein n=1 Tax=Weissella confusa TaxID=1583 RepID=UPI00396F601D